MHIEYALKQSISYLVKQLKVRSSRKLQQEFRKLSDLYWGNIFGEFVMEFGVQVILHEMVNEHLEHHRKLNSDNSNFILE